VYHLAVHQVDQLFDIYITREFIGLLRDVNNIIFVDVSENIDTQYTDIS
jgi:hypothetical protein